MNLNVVRTLTIKSKAEGVDQTTAALKGLAQAHDQAGKAAQSHAQVTETSAKRQLSTSQALERFRERTDADYRMQKRFAKDQDLINRSFEQGKLTAQQYAQDMARLHAHYQPLMASNDNLRGSFRRLAEAVATVQGPLGPIAGRLSSIGALSGGVGIGMAAAAIGVGAFAVALYQAATASLALAERAGKLQDFSETTGFTVIQLQALEKAGAQVGVASESVTKGLERFSRQMVDVRKGSGETYEQLLQVDAGLARQIRDAGSLADAWDILSRAIKNAPLEQANKLAVAFFGREGIQQTRLMRAAAEAGGIKGLVDQLNVLDRITAEQAKRWDELGDSIAENMKAAKQNVVSVFAEPSLVAMNDVSESLLTASRSFKVFVNSLTERDFIVGPETLLKIFQAMPTALAQAAGLIEKIKKVEKPSSAVVEFVGPTLSKNNPSDDLNRRKKSVEELRLELQQLFNDEKRRIDFLGDAVTIGERWTQALRGINVEVGKNSDLTAAQGRAVAAINLQFQQEIANAKVALNIADEKGILDARLAAMRATAAKAGITDAQQLLQAEAKIREGVRETIEAMRTKEQVAQANIEFERQIVFLSEEERKIATEMRSIHGDKDWKAQMDSRLAGRMREVELLKQIQDIASTALAGFAKDIANGVKPMEALLTQAKRLSEIFIDIAAKKLVAATMGSLFGGGLDTAGMTAGASSAATILNSAGLSLQASMIAGATEAAAILGLTIPTAAATLPVAGAVTGTEVGAGGVVAGTALAAGGAAAGTAIWGPIALLMAAIAAAAALFSFGGKDGKRAKEAEEWAKLLADLEQAKQRQMGFSERRSLAGVDTGTVGGALFEFDIHAKAEREKEAKEKFPQILALEGALIEERLALLRQFNQDALDVLSTDDPLSTVQQRVKDINEAFATLNQVIDAGAGGLTTKADALAKQEAALAQAREGVAASIQAQINALSGKGFINEMGGFITEMDSLFKDMGAVGGLDVSKFHELFVLGSQDIINQAELAGPAFDALIKAFPQLAGLVHAFVAEIEIAKRTADEIESEQTSIQDRTFIAGQDTGTRRGALAVLMLEQQREMEAQIKAGGENRLVLESAHREAIARLNADFDARDLAAKQAAADEALRIAEQAREAAIAAARQATRTLASFNDRIFATQIDTSTLAGALLDIDRRHLRERQENAELSGELMTRLLMAQAAERLQLEEEFHDRQIAEAQRAQDEILQIGRNIAEYLAGLSTGPQSNLAPKPKRVAAKGVFEDILAIAQTWTGVGDMSQVQKDAFARITGDAEAFRVASQGVFASGSGYQADLAQIKTSLAALAPVAQSTDPITAALSAALGPNLALIETNTGNTDTNTNATGTLATNTGTTATNVGLTTGAGSGSVTDWLKDLKDTRLERIEFNTDRTADLIVTLQSFINSNISAGSSLNNIYNATVNAGNVFAGTAQNLLTQAGFTASNTDAIKKYLLGIGGGFTGASPDRLSQIRDNLDKIVQNTGHYVGTPGGYIGAAAGATIPPHSSFIFGEHHPSGPFFGQAGSAALPVTPGFPTQARNDNRADNRELLAKIDMLTRTVGSLLTKVIELEQKNVDATERGTAEVGEQAEATRQNDRMIARKGKAV